MLESVDQFNLLDDRFVLTALSRALEVYKPFCSTALNNRLCIYLLEVVMQASIPYLNWNLYKMDLYKRGERKLIKKEKRNDRMN